LFTNARRSERKRVSECQNASPFLTECGVSERTHISLATLRRWRLENRGPKYYKFGSLVRYDQKKLIQWEQAQPSGGEDTCQRIKVKSVRSSVLMRKSG
jgi:hypothetical protein